MKRYYISAIAGDGTDEDSFRVVAMDYFLHVEAHIPINIGTGMPTQDWGLTVVFDADQTVLIGVPGVHPLPDTPLTTLVGGMSAADTGLIETAMAAHDIDPALIAGALTYGDVLTCLRVAHTPATPPN